jgi:hypothetical protein
VKGGGEEFIFDLLRRRRVERKGKKAKGKRLNEEMVTKEE